MLFRESFSKKNKQEDIVNKVSIDSMEEQDKHGPIRRAMKNIVVGAILTSSLLPKEVTADTDSNSHDKKNNKTEVVTNESIEKNKNTYYPSIESFSKNGEMNELNKKINLVPEVVVDGLSEKIKFQATNYFETDSCVISEKSKEEISSNFKILLNNITPLNYEQAIKLGIHILGSADPRATYNPKYFDKNINKSTNTLLVQMRNESFVNLLKGVLRETNLINLSESQGKYLKDNLEITSDMLTSTIVKNAEKGVIYPQDLGISESDFAQKNNTEKEEIYSRCRMVTVSFGIETKNENSEMTPNEIKFAENNYFLIDGSPSVGSGKSNDIFINQIKQITSSSNLDGKKLNLVYFDSQLGELNKINNSSELINDIKTHEYNGDVVELAIDVSIKLAQSVPNNIESKSFKIFTDEKLQGISLAKIKELQKLCEERAISTNLYFRIGGRLREVSLDEVKNIFEKQLFKNMTIPVETYIKNKYNEIDYQKSIHLNQNDQLLLVELQKNVDKLNNALRSGSLDGVLDNPLFGGRSRKVEESRTDFISIEKLNKAGRGIDFSEGNINDDLLK